MDSEETELNIHGENDDTERLKTLKEAVENISDMLCEFSENKALFLCDGMYGKRLDTKTLKEFSSVLKEVSAVAVELNGNGFDGRNDVHIEFSDDALDMSF